MKTAHVGHQWLGRYGKTGNGVVTVTTVWADERLYYPVHAVPYTPARHFGKGRSDPGFRTKLQIGADLAVRARAAGFAFRAVAADCAYGDQDGFRGELAGAGLPFVLALKPHRGTWAYGADAYTPVDAARARAWHGPRDPRDWQPVTRAFRDGRAETWFAADATLGWRGPDGFTRLVVATACPAALPPKATWYLATSLPRPGGPRAADSPHPAADLAEIVRIERDPGTGSSKATSRSRTNWAGLTSKSAPTPRSAATRPWSTAPSASAGAPASPITSRPGKLRHHGPRPAAKEGGRPPGLCCPGPRRSGAVRAWLSPWTALQRYWNAWSNAPPPPQLQALMNSVRGRLRPAPLSPLINKLPPPGTEMRAAILHLAFAGLSAREASSEAFADNDASNGVSRALGYEPNGTTWAARRGNPAMLTAWKLSRKRWEQNRRDDIQLTGVEACLPVLGLDRQPVSSSDQTP